jgi:hypothetical protein
MLVIQYTTGTVPGHSTPPRPRSQGKPRPAHRPATRKGALQPSCRRLPAAQQGRNASNLAHDRPHHGRSTATKLQEAAERPARTQRARAARRPQRARSTATTLQEAASHPTGTQNPGHGTTGQPPSGDMQLAHHPVARHHQRHPPRPRQRYQRANHQPRANTLKNGPARNTDPPHDTT